MGFKDTGTTTPEFVAKTHFLSDMELNKFAFLTLKHSMKTSGETRLKFVSVIPHTIHFGLLKLLFNWFLQIYRIIQIFRNSQKFEYNKILDYTCFCYAKFVPNELVCKLQTIIVEAESQY